MKNINIDFNNVQKSFKSIVKYFNRAGNNVINIYSDNKTRRSSGISYKEILLTFSDSQLVKLKAKSTGDIFQVLVNNRVVPIKNQDDPIKAIGEISDKLDAGRKSFQRKLEMKKVKIPATIKTSVPKMKQVLTEKRDGLIKVITDLKEQIAVVRAELV